ncbi:unnamed protein product [Symbiodinium sp. KB8]|nr:unnamed protein product [Symbiodinium sp. KB8]
MAHESQEGYQLSSYIRRGERVWCILIAKLSGNLNGTVCIEPNTLVLPKSKENLARNEVGDVRVVSGLVADASHCPHGVPFYGVDEELHGETGPAIRLPREMSYEGMSYNVESCFSLPYLASRFGTPSVLFADCEGCLPSIFRQFPSFFSRPELRMIIYEMDGDLYSYKKLHEALVEAGFKMLEFGFVCVWSRNLIPVLNLWPVYHKLLAPSLLAFLLDLLMACVLPARFTAVPFWRFLSISHCIDGSLCEPGGFLTRCVLAPLCQGDGKVKDWRLFGGLYYPSDWVTPRHELSNWSKHGFYTLMKWFFLLALIAWPAALRASESEKTACRHMGTIFSASLVAGYLLSEICGQFGYPGDPEMFIWVAASYGIYILADMHQDTRTLTLCLDRLVHAQENRKAGSSVSEGNLTGGAGNLKCLRQPSLVQERDNSDNLTNSWGAYWAKVLQSFQGFEGLLGVNLINEPFVGNPYTERLGGPFCFEVQVGPNQAADPDAIIFFPGTTSDRTGRPYTDFLPQGFQHAPGGKEFADRAVNSFHFYAPPQSLDYVKKYFTKRIQDARQLGTGLFLTESCCETFFQNVAPVVESLGMSWIHWEWKQFFRETNATRKSEDQNAAFGADKTGCGGWPYNNGVLNMTMLRYLARPYAQAIAGNFTSSSFDPSSGDFGLIFKADPKIRAPTVISVPELTYPDGVEVLVSPEGAGKFKLDQSLVQLTNNASLAHGEELTIQVKAKRTSLVV